MRQDVKQKTKHMKTLDANSETELGPFNRGATLFILGPKSRDLHELPSLNGSLCTLANVPKPYTLTKGSVYIFKAGSLPVTYSVRE